MQACGVPMHSIRFSLVRNRRFTNQCHHVFISNNNNNNNSNNKSIYTVPNLVRRDCSKCMSSYFYLFQYCYYSYSCSFYHLLQLPPPLLLPPPPPPLPLPPDRQTDRKTGGQINQKSTNVNWRRQTRGMLHATLQAPLSGTFLQTLPDLVTPLKGHSLSPRSCPPTWSAPSERFEY